MNRDFLYEMLKTPSVSGNELALQKKVKDHMEKYADEIITDHAGNVVSIINQNSNVRILLDAHIDEIGLTIANFTSDGRCKVSALGAIRPALYMGQQVQIITKDGIIDGVFAQHRQIQKDKIETSDLILDIGCLTKTEALKKVSIGDYIVHKNDYIKLSDKILSSRALDDKIGIYTILEALKIAKKNKTKNGVYASSTVGEETTANGATFLGHLVKPTMAIVVDVTSDTAIMPALENHDYIKIGDGPTVSLGTIMNKKIIDIVRECAKEHNIPLQNSTTAYRTWTNADKIHYTNQGIPVILLNIPLRYMHSCAEIVHMDDVDNLIKLIAAIIDKIDENTNFNPFN